MTARPEFALAVRDTAPLLLALMPFGVVFGALSVDSGLSVVETLGFSMIVYAGTAQFVALQLIAVSAPLWSILLAVFALNFRHVLYSASLGRQFTRFTMGQKAAAFFVLVDPLFALGETRAAERELTRTYYFTSGLVLYLGWQIATLAGAIFGGLITDQRAVGLDLALPVYFLAQTLAFRARPGFLAAAGAAAITAIPAYLFLGTPWHVTIGGVTGIAVAAMLPPRQADPAPVEATP
ncbi:AzlC family ABC transporter permease [Aureimonas mangrovi]|uniref:AzlC family ABC transporter permease n=1 Tax=Aureimonas mangrovi TaxID=2758041 RepID=UPI00163D7422|nr:AzlC family ABC transporter permease [Aureimonas mangrovi]